MEPADTVTLTDPGAVTALELTLKKLPVVVTDTGACAPSTVAIWKGMIWLLPCASVTGAGEGGLTPIENGLNVAFTPTLVVPPLASARVMLPVLLPSFSALVLTLAVNDAGLELAVPEPGDTDTNEGIPVTLTD
jgi:hypothetical protein